MCIISVYFSNLVIICVKIKKIAEAQLSIKALGSIPVPDT